MSQALESLIDEFNFFYVLIIKLRLQWSNLWDQYQNFSNNEEKTTRPKRIVNRQLLKGSQLKLICLLVMQTKIQIILN